MSEFRLIVGRLLYGCAQRTEASGAHQYSLASWMPKKLAASEFSELVLAGRVAQVENLN